MKLGQYKNKFHMEQVTGEILAALAEQQLQDDLGVANGVHRIRLLKIISGQKSVKEV